MAQITELKSQDRTRRRSGSALAVVGVTALVAGIGWFATSQLSGSSEPLPADPVSTPSASPSPVNLEPGRTVGTRLQLPLVAKAPDSWTVWKDAAYVWVDADGSTYTLPHIEITGPLLQVWDPEQRRGIELPDEGYASWLREHPSLSVLDERMVVVDGHRFPQLTVTMADDAPGDEVALGTSSDKPLPRKAWPDYSRGEVGVQTVIEVAGKTMLVSTVADLDDPAWDELDAAHELVLSTMKLPN